MTVRLMGELITAPYLVPHPTTFDGTKYTCHLCVGRGLSLVA
jgi:hypothetical protein